MHRTGLVTAVAAVAFMTSVGSAGAATFPVGHTVKKIEVAGTAPNELRAVDVHLWYPAAASTAPMSVYKSALYGKGSLRRRPVGSAVVVAHVQARARGRARRAGRHALPGDRVLTRVHQRPDQ